MWGGVTREDIGYCAEGGLDGGGTYYLLHPGWEVGVGGYGECEDDRGREREAGPSTALTLRQALKLYEARG